MKSNKEYLNHILEEIIFIFSSCTAVSKEQFMNDPLLQRACVRSIEIIGESVKNISPELKNKYTKIEWKKIAGVRDRLIHGYFSVDYDIVWDIIINKIPELNNHIKEIIINE